MFHEYFTIIFHRYLQINIPFTYSSNFQRVLLTVDSVAQELKEKNKIKRSESTGPSRTINSRQQPPKHHGFHVVKKKKESRSHAARNYAIAAGRTNSRGCKLAYMEAGFYPEREPGSESVSWKKTRIRQWNKLRPRQSPRTIYPWARAG